MTPNLEERGGGLPCSWRRIAVAAPPLRTAASRCFGVTSNGLTEAGIARSAALAPQHGWPVRNAAPVHSSGLAVQPERVVGRTGTSWAPQSGKQGGLFERLPLTLLVMKRRRPIELGSVLLPWISFPQRRPAREQSEGRRKWRSEGCAREPQGHRGRVTFWHGSSEGNTR